MVSRPIVTKIRLSWTLMITRNREVGPLKQVCAFFYRFAIYHLIMNVDAVAKQQQQFLNVNQRLKSLDPPLEVMEKSVQRRSHWHIIGYIANESETKGAKVLKPRKNCKTYSSLR